MMTVTNPMHARCKICLDNGCHNCQTPTVTWIGVQPYHATASVLRISDIELLKKIHSNRYEYAGVEFLSQGTPTVGGYILSEPHNPPKFISAQEFNTKWQPV